MAIYLDSKDLKELDQYFTLASFFKGRLSDNYDFSGVDTVRVHTVQTVDLVDYTRSGANRYGTPSEIQDMVQSMKLSRDRAFTCTIDKGNRLQGGGRTEAGKVMRAEIDEKVIPDYDEYVLRVLCTKAGQMAIEGAALSNTNIVAAIINAGVALDEKKVPRANRTLYIKPTQHAYLRLAPEWLGIDKAAQEHLDKGKVGVFDGNDVVSIPSSYWPAGVNFLLVYKESAVAPQQLDDTKIHQDPPGLSGDLLEGRNIYDCFVKMAKADGIYASLENTATRVATPTATKSGTTVTLATTTSGATVVFTRDGSDPRYSEHTTTGTSVTNVTAGEVIKAYAFKADAFDSDVLTYVVA